MGPQQVSITLPHPMGISLKPSCMPARVDRSLDEIEQRPGELQQRLFEATQSPEAVKAGKGLQAAAEIALKVGGAMQGNYARKQRFFLLLARPASIGRSGKE